MPKTKSTALKREVNAFTGYLTAIEAGEELGVSARRVRQFIKEGRLNAFKVGKQYLISKEAVFNFKDKPRKVGKPAGSTVKAK